MHTREHDMIHPGPTNGGHKRTHHERKVGGFVPKEKEVSPESEEVHKHGGKVGKHHKRNRGGHLPHEGKHHEARKHGGAVHGKEAKHRPDRKHRAAGGGVGADTHPFTSAEKMSRPSYESPQIKAEGHKGTAMEKRDD